MEFHLVGSGVVVVARVPSAPSGARRRARSDRCTLHRLDSVDNVLQFLLMEVLVGHRCFQRLDARRERLQRLQLQLNGIQVAHDGIERSLDGVPRIADGLGTHGVGERT
jgi:hypothetical protein